MTETINSFALRFVSILVRGLVAILNKLNSGQSVAPKRTQPPGHHSEQPFNRAARLVVCK